MFQTCICNFLLIEVLKLNTFQISPLASPHHLPACFSSSISYPREWCRASNHSKQKTGITLEQRLQAVCLFADTVCIWFRQNFKKLRASIYDLGDFTSKYRFRLLFKNRKRRQRQALLSWNHWLELSSRCPI